MIHIANYENFLNIDPVSDLISTGTHCHSPYAKILETSPWLIDLALILLS
jgi:ribulose-5-phosphate 4-epimerase/fuculose-1-phosphate aldolase